MYTFMCTVAAVRPPAESRVDRAWVGGKRRIVIFGRLLLFFYTRLAFPGVGERLDLNSNPVDVVRASFRIATHTHT